MQDQLSVKVEDLGREMRVVSTSKLLACEHFDVIYNSAPQSAQTPS
jgi:hypothetical protein